MRIVLRFLEKQNVQHEIYTAPQPAKNYFRESAIRLVSGSAQDDMRLLEEKLGKTTTVTKNGRSLLYYALYKIEPGFDFSRLHGCVTFEDGLLVERVRVGTFRPGFDHFSYGRIYAADKS